MGKLTSADLKMTDEKLKAYEGEVRTLRAWAYYNIFEIWGGALPLNIEPATVDGELPPLPTRTSIQVARRFITSLLPSWMIATKEWKKIR